MSDIFQVLLSQLNPQTIQQISQQIGTNPEAIQRVVQQALPVLTEAMARNASEPQGAQSLYNALVKDHDGSILDDLSGFLKNWQSGPGAGILRHVLGDAQPQVQEQLGTSNGLSFSQAGNLLQVLGPILMGVLGRKRQQSGLDLGGLINILGGGAGQQRQQASGGETLGGLGTILDRDHDGNIGDDLLDMGKGLLGNLLSKK